MFTMFPGEKHMLHARFIFYAFCIISSISYSFTIPSNVHDLPGMIRAILHIHTPIHLAIHQRTPQELSLAIRNVEYTHEISYITLLNYHINLLCAVALSIRTDTPDANFTASQIQEAISWLQDLLHHMRKRSRDISNNALDKMSAKLMKSKIEQNCGKLSKRKVNKSFVADFSS